MRLGTVQVAEIRASEGVYRASDVARAYGCHRSTVIRIWENRIHTDVRPALEPPNVTSRPRPSELTHDIRLLLDRGMSPVEVADQVGVSVASVYAVRGLFI